MKERPILFSTPMVHAIMEGRKTMTRRVVKGTVLEWLQPEMFTPEYVALPENGLCPYGQPGDLLWVREKFKSKHVKGCLEEFKLHYPNVHPWFYAADGESEKGYGSWKPSIHMPKSAARIWLRITDVRLERLHDISEEDAKAEGVEWKRTGWKDYTKDGICFDAISSFVSLWQSINGIESWDQNPWVWVVSFEIIKK